MLRDHHAGGDVGAWGRSTELISKGKILKKRRSFF